MRGKRTESKIIDDSFNNWGIEHEEEINEILQPFIKMPSKTREIETQSIYVSSKKGEMILWVVQKILMSECVEK